MHHVDSLAGVPGPDVGHDVGRLLATELAVRALEPGRLAALVLEVPGHVALDGEATSALGAAERLPEAVGERALRVRVPHPGLGVVIGQGPRHRRATGLLLASLAIVPLAVVPLARL